MYGVLFLFSGIIILIVFWINGDIEIKWKIILTILLVGLRFLLPGVFALIGSALVLVAMLLMLRWNGVNL